MARNINELHPELQKKVKKLQEMCEKEGLKLGIGECFRSKAEQDALYAQGRTKPGNIVTNAKGSTYSSQHQWGIAFDIFKNVKGHEYDDTAFFKKVAKLAKSIGLAWGGDWTSIVDMPHFYLPDWGSTTSKLKSQYGTFSKFKKTWPKEFEPYKIRITCKTLIIRSGAGKKYKLSGYITKREDLIRKNAKFYFSDVPYVIVEEKKAGGITWGRLKSGIGWINLSYARKVK